MTKLLDPRTMSLEDRRQARAAIDAVNKTAFDNWYNDAWRREMAQAMTETIYLGFEHESLLNYMTTVENAQFNDRSFVKEVKGLRAHWVARGGYIEVSTLRADVFEIPRDTIGFHVMEFEDKLRTNFAESQATLVELGIERLDSEVNLRMFRALQAAVPASSPYYIQGNGLSLTALNTALREVRDETRDREIAIIGRGLMTDQIIDQLQAGNFTGFLPTTNEELLRTGLLGTYRGANIISLKNYRDDTDVPFFPGNELFVVGRDASKFTFWDGMLTKEFNESDAWYWHYMARRDFGGIVHRPNRIRRIVDNSIAPYTIVEQ